MNTSDSNARIRSLHNKLSDGESSCPAMKNKPSRWVLPAIVCAVMLAVAGVLWGAMAAHQLADKTQQCLRWMSIMDEMDGGVLLVDGHTGTITYANDGLREYLGYSRGDLVGRSADILIEPGSHMQKHSSMIWGHKDVMGRNLGKILYLTCKMLAKDGSLKDVLIRIEGTKAAGSYEYSVIVNPLEKTREIEVGRDGRVRNKRTGNTMLTSE